jgi:DNA-binding CsgD family transcriptional regulator
MAYRGEPPDSLLDEIYDAATDAPLWSSVLTRIADLTGSQGGILFGQSVRNSVVYFDHNGRLDDACNAVYKARHMHNTWSLRMERFPAGALVGSEEVMPLAELRRTAFYDEVLHPQDVAYNAMIPLAKDRDFTAAFNLCRSARQGPLDEPGRRLLLSLLPHLQRTMRLGYRLAGYEALQQAQYAVLERLAVGVVLLDRLARVLYANQAARALGAGHGPVRLSPALRATTPPQDRQLARLIALALAGKPTGAMSLVVPSDGRLVAVLVSSVRGNDRNRFADLRMHDAAAMVFLSDAANAPEIPAQRVMDAYGLTLGEARVALSIASGASVPEVAMRLALSPNTVKTHLRRVFAKTGAARQAELVLAFASLRLVGGSNEPRS